MCPLLARVFPDVGAPLCPLWPPAPLVSFAWPARGCVRVSPGLVFDVVMHVSMPFCARSLLPTARAFA